MKLVIVESPTKARTISKFLDKSYKVESSFGHIRDLPTKELGVDLEKDFEPKYVIPSKAKKRVSDLKKLAAGAEQIILATDEDREGEAISWHLLSALKVPEEKTERITFHEITKTAIQEALKHPRKIDMNTVDAQQARRVLDRLVGYELSPFLWKKIRKGLSAGRVQSVAVRLIVEREREIENFKKQKYWEIGAILKKDAQSFLAKLWKKDEKIIGKLEIDSQEKTEEIENFLKIATFTAKEIQQKEIKKSPPAPFTTSSLQQAASSQLGFSPKQTMTLAQQLYEGINLGKEGSVGLITYMRTDSFNLSSQCLASAKEKITQMFGKEYALESPRRYKTKSKGAQEAHEAIRPTFVEKDPESIKDALDPKQYKLYKLIWIRTIACQMAEAKIKSTSVQIKAEQANIKNYYWLKANGSQIIFDGYLKVIGKENAQDNFLPIINKEDNLPLEKLSVEEKETQPPARYSEASLIKVLEENGIGRPSTYAPTISTVQDRGYVEKDQNKKLFPTEVGFLVNDLLVAHFDQIVDYQFTAQMEEELDGIAEGKRKWNEVIKEFHEPFVKNLKEKTKEVKKADFQKTIEDRKCPNCGGELVEKFGRYGKFIACKNFPECKFTENIQEKLEVPCPKCGSELIERKTKKGKTFYGCSGWPKCDFALWNKPTGEKCPDCSSLLVQGPRNLITCSNKECKFKKDNEE